ncbi:hypothetical protein HYH03_008620 [Edaphochlamys debaryana]|uniref:phosphopantothenoylcysteine decarboxylase n=1 Tax=Edaphochlamys debaryana TaxID=47281 RepID=A0A835Y019_9CHLO|nr:hypothetical protein HYH03_008620 [Edaphochlamys debaryana]|eukprot:KAG2493200.1 hypothetical protein HYH03_008620 [Edaphochlamys debaryana]
MADGVGEATVPSGARRPRVLLGATGSVASIKVAALCQLLLEFADVKLVVTSSAKNFINEDDLPEAVKPILGDEAEWRQWRSVGDPVLHIELRRWADALVVAPLSANSLAKMANGMADNLLTCVVRAWDFAKPMLLAPAMNTAMWASPFTARHLDTLVQLGGGGGGGAGSSGGVGAGAAMAASAGAGSGRGVELRAGAAEAASAGPAGGAAGGGGGGWGGGGGGGSVAVVPPVVKRLACGDEGAGAMAAPADVAAATRAALQRAGVVGGAGGQG